MTEIVTDTGAKKAKGKAVKKSPPAPSAKKPGRWTESFPIKLSHEELAKKGNVAAALDAEIESLEADKKSAVGSFKGRIDAKKSELRDTMRAIRTGEEWRPVDVVEEFDFRTNTCRVVRSDTGATVRTRALTLEERQADLFNGKTKDGAQTSLATIGDAVAAKAAKKTNGANGAHAKKGDDGPTEITEPGALLDGAKPEDEPAKRRPARRRGR